MKVTVRRAKQTDAARVAKMAVLLVEQHVAYDPRRFSKLYDESGAARFYGATAEQEDAAVFVAEIDNDIVGFAYIECDAIDYPALLRNGAWLNDIYLDETARKHGAGALLIEAVAAFAKNFGSEKLLLTVAAKNSLAQDFFTGRGFKPTMIEMMLDLGEE
jgi:GNAT superfamily N-acetyltransferase